MPKDEELRPLMTRLPERLRRKLERAAATNKRSMNTEIIHRLDQSFAAESKLERLDVGRVLARIEDSMSKRDKFEKELFQALMRVAPEEAREVLRKTYGEGREDDT